MDYVKAVQYDGTIESRMLILNWANTFAAGAPRDLWAQHNLPHNRLTVWAREEFQEVAIGDWVVQGLEDEFFRVKEADFLRLEPSID